MKFDDIFVEVEVSHITKPTNESALKFCGLDLK